MSIIIQNISQPDAPLSETNKYRVRINQTVICEFDHDRKIDGLAQCLRDAADAVDAVRADREANVVKINPEPGTDATCKSCHGRGVITLWGQHGSVHSQQACPLCSKTSATVDPGHTCSYHCTVPEHVLRQRDELRERVERLDWKPIESAPQDDSLLLLGWFETWPKIEWRMEVAPAGNLDTGRPGTCHVHGRATHWMELPKAPEYWR